MTNLLKKIIYKDLSSESSVYNKNFTEDVLNDARVEKVLNFNKKRISSEDIS